MDKKQSRLRRARQTRLKIAQLRVNRLSVFRTNTHIYANIIDATGSKVLVSASTVNRRLRKPSPARVAISLLRPWLESV